MINNEFILFDRIKEIKRFGLFKCPIISKLHGLNNSMILSNNIEITKEKGIRIIQGLKVGFKESFNNEKIAFTEIDNFSWKNPTESLLEYSVFIPKDTMEQYDQGQIFEDFPFILTFLHTSLLYLIDEINHLDFMKGEIINNPVSLIMNGIVIADRVVADQGGNLYFYDCIIVGRDANDDLNMSYEVFIKIDDKVVEYIIILGREDIGFDKIGMIIKSGVEREIIKKKRAELIEQVKKEQEQTIQLKKKKENEKKVNLKEKFLEVEKLLQDNKFSEAIMELKEIREEAENLNLDDIVNRSNENLDLCYILLIKKTILDLGTKFARIQIVEISEVSEIVDEKLIISTVKDMIKNKEIYAKYFESSKSIAFDQQANIEEIDKLISIYKDWEEKKIGKK